MKLALYTLCCGLSLYGTQATAPEKPKDEKCSIEGRVLNSVTGEAVRKATLMLLGAGTGMTPTKTETEENGQFSFQGLEAGALPVDWREGRFCSAGVRGQEQSALRHRRSSSPPASR